MAKTRITFSAITEAVQYAKEHGGWIFRPENDDIAYWYDPSWTPSTIFADIPYAGFLGTCGEFAC